MDELPRTSKNSGGGVELTLFAAMQVPIVQARQLAEHAERASSRVRDARLVEPESMHVTFAYLGPVSEEHVPAVAAALESTAFSMPGPTALTVAGVELFGGERVLAACLHADLHVILDPARDAFIDAVRPFAPQLDDRDWRPHTTIMRAARGGVLPRSLAHEHVDVTPSTWVAPELRLMASLPAPGARQHRLLHSVPFGQPVRGA